MYYFYVITGKYYLTFITGLVVILLMAFPVRIQAQTNYLKQGIAFFKKTQYSKALNNFLKSEQQGNKKSALKYNIAVTYFKLGEYTKAEKYFITLTRDKRFRQLAHYNLGLIAMKQGNKSRAHIWFQKAFTKKANPKISILAKTQLAILKRNTRLSEDFDVGASIAYGYDNNVLLLPDDSPSQRGDNYTEYAAYAGVNLPGQLKLASSFIQQDFNTINSADYSQIAVSLERGFQLSNWQLTPRLRLSQSKFGLYKYQHVNDLRLTATHKFDRNSRLLIRYRYSDITSRDQLYDYLQGTRHQFRIGYKQRKNNISTRYRYQFELNNRQDTATSSYSPVRNTIRGRLRYKIFRNLRLETEAGYRRSDYPEKVNIKRVDSRLRLQFGVRYRLSKRWKFNVQYIYTDNNSNLNIQKYKRKDLQISANYYFE